MADRSGAIGDSSSIHGLLRPPIRDGLRRVMHAFGFTRWAVASLALLVLLSSCKPKPAPAPPFEGTCAVSQMKVDAAQSVSVLLELAPKAGTSVRPAGMLLLQVLEMGPSPTLKCTPQTRLSESSYRADFESAPAIPFEDYCLVDSPLESVITVRSFFTPENAPNAIECSTGGPVPKAWGGHDKTPAEQQAAIASARTTATPKASPTADVDPRPVVRIDMKDALRFPNGTIDEGPHAIRVYARVPDSWIQSGALTPKAKTAVLAKMYGGPNWEKGNGDGSLYIVRSFASHPLTPAEIAVPVWSSEPAGTTWFYETKPDGALEKRGPNFGPPPPLPKAEHLDHR